MKKRWLNMALASVDGNGSCWQDAAARRGRKHREHPETRLLQRAEATSART